MDITTAIQECDNQISIDATVEVDDVILAREVRETAAFDGRVVVDDQLLARRGGSVLPRIWPGAGRGHLL